MIYRDNTGYFEKNALVLKKWEFGLMLDLEFAQLLI